MSFSEFLGEATDVDEEINGGPDCDSDGNIIHEEDETEQAVNVVGGDAATGLPHGL